MSDYDFRPGGSLKLKTGVQEGGVTKKKKKKKHDKLKDDVDKKRKEFNDPHRDSPAGDKQEGSSSYQRSPDAPPSRLTEAERKYRESKAKRMGTQVSSKAHKSHKELVADFNEKLERLSEHHDIPKVGPG